MSGLGKWSAAYGTLLLSHSNTNLASMADGNCVGGSDTDAVIDNTTNLNFWIDVVVGLGSITPTGNPYVGLYVITSIDGTNYEDVFSTTQGSTLPPAGVPYYQHGVTTGASAKLLVIRRVEICPGKSKLVLLNKTTQTLNASSNYVKYCPSYGINNNG